MLLSHKTKVCLSTVETNVIGHMCYAAYKLWNVCNYERRNYKELGLGKYPDWYYQKKEHKEELWYKQLPSQTAQEICKQLDKSWKSYYVLMRTGGIQNPRPPRFKQEPMVITYMQNAVRHEKGSERVRLTVSRQMKEYMKSEYQVDIQYLNLENEIFKNIDVIKQIKIYPPKRGKSEIIVIYEVPDAAEKEDNGHYLSIDLGLHNLMTCYDSGNGNSFIIGRKYLSIEHRYHKEISRVQSRWYQEQHQKGVRYPKTSKHIQKLYEKKNNSIRDYLHKMTHYVVSYCKEQEIHRVVIGDIRNIRKEKDLGKKTNQKLHGLPYERVYMQLEYKLKKEGIVLIRQEESYTSQCSPKSPEISRKYAEKKNRRNRGLYRDGDEVYNADAVGAYNILRKHMENTEREESLMITGLSSPKIIKVAV